MNTFADGIEAAAKLCRERRKAHPKTVVRLALGETAAAIERLTPPAPEPVADQSGAWRIATAWNKRHWGYMSHNDSSVLVEAYLALLARGTRTPSSDCLTGKEKAVIEDAYELPYEEVMRLADPFKHLAKIRTAQEKR